MRISATRTLPFLGALLLAGRSVQAQTYTPSYDFPHRTQVVAVYLGASFCVACVQPEFKQAMTQMAPELKQVADRSGRDFATIGVSLDWDVDSGIAFLKPVTQYDEIVVGSNWINSAVARLIWADSSTTPSLPQVVLIERQVDAGARVSIKERVIGRYVGGDEIQRWIRQGTPLPTTPSPAGARPGS